MPNGTKSSMGALARLSPLAFSLVKSSADDAPTLLPEEADTEPTEADQLVQLLKQIEHQKVRPSPDNDKKRIGDEEEQDTPAWGPDVPLSGHDLGSNYGAIGEQDLP